MASVISNIIYFGELPVKNILKSLLLAATFISTIQISNAQTTNYTMRVDGLACPFCAYGIEKKFKAIDGVSNINVDLEEGIVSLDANETVVLKEDQMKELFNDSGFTYRSMTKTVK